MRLLIVLPFLVLWIESVFAERPGGGIPKAVLKVPASFPCGCLIGKHLVGGIAAEVLARASLLLSEDITVTCPEADDGCYVFCIDMLRMRRAAEFNFPQETLRLPMITTLRVGTQT